MYKILRRTLGENSSKCIGYDIKNLNTGIEGCVSKDMAHGLVACGLVVDLTLGTRGNLQGINSFRASNLKTRQLLKCEQNEFKDLNYFEFKQHKDIIGGIDNEIRDKILERSDDVVKSKIKSSDLLEVSFKDSKLDKLKKENKNTDLEFERLKTARKRERSNLNYPNTRQFKERVKRKSIKRGRLDNSSNNIIEFVNLKVNAKSGFGFIIVKTSDVVFDNDLKLVSMKNKDCGDGHTMFSTYLRNLLCRLEDLDLSKYQLIVREETLNSLKKCMVVAKNHKFDSVDMFNIVQSTLVDDIKEFYDFLCNNAIFVDGVTTKVI